MLEILQNLKIVKLINSIFVIKRIFFSISYILVFTSVPILNFSVLGSLSNIVSIYSIYFSIFTIITKLLSLFFPSHISPFKKRRKDFEISKFSPSICVWKQIRMVLQWSVLLNIKRDTKTSYAIVVIRLAAIAISDRIKVSTKIVIATTGNTT